MYINGLEVFRIFNGKLKLGVLFDQAYVKVSDVKAYNVSGGTSTSATWHTRDINTEDSDDSNICSIASNQITLDAGTYICSIFCLSHGAARNFVILYNVTDSSVELLGPPLYLSPTTYLDCVPAKVVGKFTISAQKTFEIRHYIERGQATYGLGVETGVAGYNSVYTIAEFWKQ